MFSGIRSVKKIRFICLCLTAFCHAQLYAEHISDPTRPVWLQKITTSASGINAATSWSLTSTLIASQRRLATINNKTVAIGGIVDGARVMEIMPTHVRLRKDGKEFELKLLSVGRQQFHKRIN